MHIGEYPNNYHFVFNSLNDPLKISHMKNASLLYCSFIVDDDCTAIVSQMFCIFFFLGLAIGEIAHFWKRGIQKRGGIIYKGEE